MSFTRLDYDPCTYRTDLLQSVGPSDYLMATPALQCATCLSGDPWVQGGGAASICRDRPLVDVDSELHNLSRPATNCPAGHYHPSSTPFCTRTDFPDCHATSIACEDTRLTNPPCTLRGTGWNRWQWLCQDPQDKVQMPFDWNIDSKLVAKDNHRPCLPIPLDQTTSLPRDDQKETRWSPDCPPQLDGISRVDWRSCSTMHQL